MVAESMPPLKEDGITVPLPKAPITVYQQSDILKSIEIFREQRDLVQKEGSSLGRVNTK